MDENVIEMLKLLSTGVDDKYDALQKLQQEPIQRGMRNQGQSTKDFFLKPTGAQNRAMLEMAGGILNRDRTKPGMAGINEGYRRGLDLMDEIRQREKDDKVKSATLDIAKDKDQWGRMTDMLKLAPKPEKPTWNKVEYLDQNGAVSRSGYAAYKNGSWVDENGTQLAPGTFRPLTTGRTPEDVAAQNPMKSTEAGVFAQAATATELIKEAKKGVYDKDGSVNRKALFQAGDFSRVIPFYDGVGLPFTEGQTLATHLSNAVDSTLRLRSGKTIPIAERKPLIAMVTPKFTDSDETIEAKFAIMESIIGGQLTAMMDSPEEGKKLIQKALSGEVDPRSWGGGPSAATTGKTPSGRTYTISKD